MSVPDSVLKRLVREVDLPDLSGTPYEIRDEIGRGGMGTVYRAFDNKLHREIALKVTDASLASEAKIAASLEHPGIVPVYDAGLLPDGRAYSAMRWVRGKPLDMHVAPDAPLSERLAIFQKICEAAAFAHNRGVVHRDLKPANIMVGEFGEVTILDWGVARHADEAPLAVSGTPRFMAPEQARGESPSPLADIYSLGAVLDVLLPQNAARPLRAIAAKAQQADPAQRYPSAETLVADLRRHLDGYAVEAYHESLFERAARFARRNATLLLLVGAYFAVRIAVYFFYGR